MQFYELLDNRVFIPRTNSSRTRRFADDVVLGDGPRTAVEAKYIERWSNSIYNPSAEVGSKQFAKDEVDGIVDQARDYCAEFEGGVIYYTNSVEFADYYTKIFYENGITKFRFVIVPVEYQ